MLHAPTAVLQHGGKLSLNEHVCWTDVWEFERLVSDGLHRLNSGGTDDVPAMRLRSALDLYAGDFLACESEESWMLAPRLRLRSKFERLIAALSTHLEQRKQFSEATDLCHRALELDPFNESLYRRLMRCYLNQGEIAGALGTYLRCCEALSKGLAAPISCETERLHLEVSRAAAERGIRPLINPSTVTRAYS
jgi:DNA-binding SARP family transcriptional activator